MAQLAKDRLISQIRLTCKKIKFTDLLEFNIIEDVFHISIDDLQVEMKKFHLLGNSAEETSHFLSQTVRSCTTEELREKLNHLKAWGVATNNQKRTWKAFTLLDPLVKEVRPIHNAYKLKKELLRSFRIKSLNADINVIEYQKKLWCAISGKKLTRRSGVKMEPTVFFCISPSSPHLFVAPMNVPSVKLQRVIHALNYNRVRNCHLTGKNINSLLKMLETRVETDATLGDVTLSPDVNIEVGRRHTDFSQAKKIERYANRCFNKEVVLQTFTVESVSEWRGGDIVPAMNGEQFNTTMEISSRNVAKTLSYYASIGLIKPPFPSYIKNFMCSGKNDVKLRTKK